MKLTMLFLFVAILALADYILIKRKELKSYKLNDMICSLWPRGWKEVLCYILIPITTCCVALMLNSFYSADALYTLKRMVLIGLLWPIAINDYREYKIPNKLILIGLALRVLLMIPEMIVYGNIILSTFVLEVVAAIGAIVVCLVCMMISRGSMGMGDLKLMVLMGMYLGVEGLCYAMFVSLFVSFIVAVSLLVSRKKSRTDAIPFAPFILIGTLLSLILSGT